MTKTPKSIMPESLQTALLLAVPPQNLPPEREARLKQRIMAKVGAPAGKAEGQFLTVRAGAGTWTPIGERVELQVLYDDGAVQSWLVRMQADSRLPSHAHLGGDEECLVLQGSCYLGGTFMQQGDYQLARKGSRHSEVYSEGGCLLFIRSPERYGAPRAVA